MFEFIITNWSLIIFIFSVLISCQTTSVYTEYKKEVLANLREECCRGEDYDTLCTDKKCYFVINNIATWPAARASCRRSYVKWPGLSDAASFEDSEEIFLLQNVTFLESTSTENDTNFWTGGVYCPNNSTLSGNDFLWTSGKSISAPFNNLTYLNSSRYVNSCAFLAVNIDLKDHQFEDEETELGIICELRIPEFKYSTVHEHYTSLEDISTTEKTDFTDSTTVTTTVSETVPTTKPDQITISTTTTITPKITRCKSKESKNILWPETPAGETALRDCPKGFHGTFIWYCNENGEWFPEEPNTDNCISEWLNNLDEKINESKNSEEFIEISNTLSERAEKQNMTLGDINGVLKIVGRLRTAKIEKDLMMNFSETNLKTVSSLLNDNHRRAWEHLTERRKTASLLLEEVESTGAMIVCNSEKEQIIKQNNLILQSYKFLEQNQRNFRFPQSQTVANTSTYILLPPNLGNIPSSCGIDLKGYGVLYNGIGSHLTAQTKHVVNSRIISFNFGNNTGSIKFPTGSYVEVVLEHIKNNKDYDSNCAFWNFTKLEWENTDCKKVSSNKSHTVCRCSHLTNFAVLMDISGNLEIEDPVMTILTYVCCSLSILALLITVCCLIGLRAAHSRRSTITCNLCFCLLVVNLLVIFGLKETKIRIICSIIAGVLHYSAVASFTWMLLEGYHLYQMVIVVFNRTDTVKFRWLYVIGYGIPFLVVIPSVSISPDSYGGEKSCWISSEHGFMWSFAGPITAIILANTVILVMALRSAYNVKIKKQRSPIRNALGWMKGSFSLLSLLGITWIVGFLYIVQQTYYFAYIFIILNGLQGVFVMIFHIILNEKVRHSFLMFVTRAKISSKNFSSSMRTTTSHNPLQSQTSVQPFRTHSSYLSNQKRSSVSPVNTAYYM